MMSTLFISIQYSTWILTWSKKTTEGDKGDTNGKEKV